jgi:hypothetical protein
MTDTLADEIVRWDRETRAILLSIKRLVKYFGTDEEYEWLVAALHEPEEYFEGILPAFRDSTWKQNITTVSIPPFTFERGTAKKINPLLVILKEFFPDFIGWAREELEPAHFKAMARYCGGFFGNIDYAVSDLIWRRFPDLALEGYPNGDRSLNSGEAQWSKYPRKVVNDTAKTLADEIVRWDNETRAILTSIKRIVEYFGTDEEYESLLAALRNPEACFESVLPAFRDPASHEETSWDTGRKFECERGIAEKITPLLQLLAEPVPEFVPWAREELEEAHSSVVIRSYGAFVASAFEHIYDPVWRSFPDLALEGYPLKPDWPSGD